MISYRYPNDNWPGYPTSGPVGQPREYDKFEPVYVEKTDDTLERGLYKSPYYVPLYPTWYNNGARPSAVTSEEIDALIPGIDLYWSILLADYIIIWQAVFSCDILCLTTAVKYQRILGLVQDVTSEPGKYALSCLYKQNKMSTS